MYLPVDLNIYIMKKIINLLSILLVFALGQSLYGAGKKTDNAKNIIFILADDMGYHLSAVGTPGIKTPAIDGLAKDGTLFSNAFSVCSSCSPSRSSILTGMYPHANGHWRNTLGPLLSDPDEDFSPSSQKADRIGVRDWVQTLPEMMNRAGYFTAIMNKFHLSYPYKYPFSGRYHTPTSQEAYYNDVKKIIEDAGDKPFFIQANIASPHRPFMQHAYKYKGEWPDKADLELFPYLPDMDSVRQDLLYYYVSVMLTDQITGRILDALKDVGKEKETLIVFTSDHGPAFHRSKATAYYAGAHVPLVVKGANVQKGIVNHELVSLIDLLPTMFDYLGLTVPDQVQGESLLPLIVYGQSKLEGREYIFVTHNSHGPDWKEFYPSRAIFDGRYYLIKNLKPDKKYLLPADLYMGGHPWGNLSYPAIVNNKNQFPDFYQRIVELEGNRPPWELYDMENDPGQMNNVYGLPLYEKRRNELEKDLESWQVQTGDTIMDTMINSFK